MTAPIEIDPQVVLIVRIVLASVIGVIAVGSMLALGVFSQKPFVHAPARRGNLGVVDLIVGLVLWIGGQLVGWGVGTRLAEGWYGPIDLENPLSDPRSAIVLVIATSAGSMLGVVYLLVRAAVEMDEGLGGLGLSLRRPLRLAAWTALAGVVVIFVTLAASMATTAISELFGYEAPKVAHDLLIVIMTTDSVEFRWTLILIAVVAAPVVEEFMFRGLVQTTLIQVEWFRERRWLVIAAASILFAVIHLGSVPVIALPMLFTLSLGLGYAYERTGRLWAPMAIHSGFNALNIWFSTLQADMAKLQEAAGGGEGAGM